MNPGVFAERRDCPKIWRPRGQAAIAEQEQTGSKFGPGSQIAACSLESKSWSRPTYRTCTIHLSLFIAPQHRSANLKKLAQSNPTSSPHTPHLRAQHAPLYPPPPIDRHRDRLHFPRHNYHPLRRLSPIQVEFYPLRGAHFRAAECPSPFDSGAGDVARGKAARTGSRAENPEQRSARCSTRSQAKPQPELPGPA